MSSVSRLAKKLSARALSYASPTDPMLWAMPALRHLRPNAAWCTGRAQPVVATRPCHAECRSSSSASAGVFQTSVLRGLVLSARATASRSARECRARSVPFGKYCRSGRSCSRSSCAARDCAGRRSRCRRRCRFAVGRAGPAPLPGPRSATAGAARAWCRWRPRSRPVPPRRRGRR